MVTKHTLFVLVSTLFPVPLAAQAVVTAYADGQVLLRQTVPVRVPAGASELKVALRDCDPGSIIVDDPGVVLRGARYDNVSDEAGVIRRSVGQRVTFYMALGRDTVVATIRSVDPLVLELDDGRVLFRPPGIPIYPAAAVRAGQQLLLSLQSQRSLDSLRLACTSSGLSWSAEYDVEIGSRGSQLRGVAVLQSSQLALRDATIRLVSGTVARSSSLLRDEVTRPVRSLQPEQEYWFDRAVTMSGMSTRGVQAGPPQASRVGETHTYLLPGRYELEPGMTTLAPLIEPTAVTVERSYVVPGRLPAQGEQFASNRTEEVQASVMYTVTRPRGAGVSDVPLPPGGVRLYAPAPDGVRQLIGEVTMGSLPSKDVMRLVAGPAYGLLVSRRDFNQAVEQDTLRDPFRVRRSATLLSYEVTVRNVSDSAVAVDVVERRQSPWSVVESTVAPEPLSPSETRFRVSVPAHSARVLTYRLRVPVQDQ